MQPGNVALERGDSGVAIVAISGEHDLSTAPRLRRQLEEAIGEGGPVVVDLSEADFIDSSILGAILDVRREAHQKGIGFAIALEDGRYPVARVLEVTGLNSNLPVHPARTEALAEARRGAPSS